MRDLQKAINDWQNAMFPDTTPMAAAVKLNGEVAELLTAISIDDPIEDIAEECADVIHLVCDLARTLHIDLDQATWTKLAKNHKREWNVRSDGTGQHRPESTK